MDEELQKARQLALKYLGQAARSAEQVRQRLEKASFPAPVIDEVLAELAQRRWLDDEQFARSWLEGRLGKRAMGRQRLAQELAQRGVAAETAARVLGEFAGALNDPEAMVGLLRRQRGRYAGLEEQKAKRRMLDFLRRRGYAEDGVWRAVNQVWKEMQGDEIEGD
ncbi:MAG: regulatory protein RecX [Candidatus Handelsmanbacteria bacterium]|nr:regulatory protein RecX [Candidatus Handelsmanbacteria bacterium]